MVGLNLGHFTRLNLPPVAIDTEGRVPPRTLAILMQTIRDWGRRVDDRLDSITVPVIPLAPDWVDGSLTRPTYQSPRLTKVGSIVVMQGLLERTGGNLAVNSAAEIVASFDPIYAPMKQRVIVVVSCAQGQSRVDITPEGTVRLAPSYHDAINTGEHLSLSAFWSTAVL